MVVGARIRTKPPVFVRAVVIARTVVEQEVTDRIERDRDPRSVERHQQVRQHAALGFAARTQPIERTEIVNAPAEFDLHTYGYDPAHCIAYCAGKRP